MTYASDCVLYHARMSPDKPAVIFTGGVATFGMLGDAVRAAARRIVASGLSPGMTAAIQVRNPFHHTALILALEQCGIASLSVPASHDLALSGLAPDAVLLDRFGFPVPGASPLAVDEDWFADTDGDAPACRPGVPPGGYVRVLVSSGTTGVPKAIGLTGEVLRRRMLGSAIWGGVGDRMLVTLGFSTIGSAYLFETLTRGGAACFAPSPEEVLHMVRVFGVTHLLTTPAQLHDLVACQEAVFAPCPSLLRVTVGGSPMSEEFTLRARAALCSDLVVAYATTETGGLAYRRAGSLPRLEGAVGHAVPGVRIEAVDADGVVLPPGRQGLLRVRSDKIGDHLSGRGEARPLCDAEGWFHPGDIGAVTADGLVAVVGKSTEVITCGGTIIAPHVIEDLLVASRLVTDAGVFEMRHDADRAEIWGGVVAGDDADVDAALAHCERWLGARAPSVLVRLDAIPRGAMGKIRRDELRQAVMRRYAAVRAGADGAAQERLGAIRPAPASPPR